MGCYLFYYTGRLSLGLAIPMMKEELSYSSEQLGWLAGAALASYGVGQAINGNLGDWLGGRLMVSLGAIGSMILCWVFSFMDAALWLLVIWTANGYVQSMGWAPGGKLISTWWPARHRGLAFGLYMLAAGLATVLVWCSSYEVLDLFDADDPSRWRWLFRLPVLGLGGAGMLFFLLVRDAPQDVGLPAVNDEEHAPSDKIKTTDKAEAETNWFGRYLAVLGNPWFLLAAIVIVFQSFARYGLLTWITSYYIDAGLNDNDALQLTLSLPIGMGLGALAGGYFSDRWFLSRRAAVVATFLAVSSVCFLVMRANPVVVDGDQRLGIALLFLAGFFVYGAQGPLWAMCPELVGRAHSGTAVGLMDALAYAGAAAQGPLLGWIIEGGSGANYGTFFVLLASITGTGALLAVVSAMRPART